jgi:sugar phosphate isomerase/epimerase
MSLPNPRPGRRRFLAASAAASASLLSARLPAAPPPPLRFGLVTYQWGKDMPLPELLEVCARTRVAGVELRSTHRHGVEPALGREERAEARRRFADSPVALVGLGSACEYHAPDAAILQRNIDETRAFIDLSAELGGSGVKVRPNALPAEVPVERTLEQIGNALRVVGDHAARAGQQIRVEVHGRGTQEIPHMRRIMEIADHPHVVVCWNCNPTDLVAPGFAANFESLAPWMGTVHIHDLRPGRVDYPWEDLFARLKTCAAPGFTGWCLLEDGSTPDDIPAALEENRLLFERFTA